MAPADKQARPVRRDSEVKSGPGVLAYTGLTLSLVGALLDFASGYLFALVGGGMAVAHLAEASMYILGGVVLVVGILSVASFMGGRMRWLGIAMEVLGVVMAVASGLVPGMSASLSDAMLVVGALMIINGALMQRKRGMKREKVP